MGGVLMWQYRAALINVLDGDTIRCLVDLGASVRIQLDLRLDGVSAPELSQPGGQEARGFVVEWMAGLRPVRWPLLVHTSPNTNPEPEERRSFVRYIASVWDIGATRYLNGELAAFLALHPDWPTGN
jgi:hypothetical protein